MPNERVSMSKLKQLIGLQTSYLSVRELARTLGLSIGAVSKYQRAAPRAGRHATDLRPPLPVDDGRVLNQLAVWAPDSALRHAS